MEEILSAKRVLREQTFKLFVPFSELTEKENLKKLFSEHSLFVQGSIDLLLETVDGDLILVDYKTDRMTAEERKNPSLFHARMKKTHGTQLFYYQKAVKQLFSGNTAKAWIYSLSLGEVIEIE
jgi:ATP-dependent helicase/nuclease subunit A